MKKFLSIIISLMIIATSSACTKAEPQKYSMHFFNTFDTIISIVAFADSKEIFDEETNKAKELYELYNKYFDIYNQYEGITNLYTLNNSAAKAPVKVDDILFDFLLYSKNLQKKYDTGVNLTFGAVLNIWHNFRDASEANPSKAAIPSMEALQAANKQTNIDDLVLDENNKTVYFKDEYLKIDAGALAKGYATELVAKYLLNSKIPHFIISAGGNVRSGLKPLDNRDNWNVGISDPFTALYAPTNTIDTVKTVNNSIVTSGDYQRYFTVDGKNYHHIIDPKTLMPANSVKAITVITQDSGIADFLSTALFIKTYEESLEFLKQFNNVDVFWVFADGTTKMTDGYSKLSSLSQNK